MSDNVTLHLEGKYTTLDQRVSHLDNQMGDFKGELSSLRSDVRNLTDSVRMLVERYTTPNPTNWVGIGMLLIAIMGGVAAYTTLSMDPVKAKQNWFDDKVAEHEALLRDRGGFIAQALVTMQDHGQEIDRLWDRLKDYSNEHQSQGERLAAAEAKLEALQTQLNHVDSQGSRVWNKAGREK